MPIYEYRCLDCGRYQSVLVRTFSEPTDLQCPRCQGAHFRKLVSRFAVLRSDESRLDDLPDPSAIGDVYENDPRSVARLARKMGVQGGEGLGEEFHEMVDRFEACESSVYLGGDGNGAGSDEVADYSMDVPS